MAWAEAVPEARRVDVSIGYGALWVVIEDDPPETEFQRIDNSGEPECQEVWNNLKGEYNDASSAI